jgi:hypothetical protein
VWHDGRVNRPASLTLFLGVVLVAVLVGGWLRTAYAPEWRPTATPLGLRPWAVEADCYSQLARVQRILRGQGLVQNHFTVENWPEGLTPSTTAPFDYVILALWVPLALITPYPLDWAGALVSPVLALALAAFWTFFRSRCCQRTGRAALIVGLALIPGLVWATAFGRPRHQSLILALLAVALTAEYERWEKDAPRAWNIAAGIAWGLACWTSLYEPLLLVLLLIVYNLAVRRRESPAFAISFGAVLLLALAIEGIHVYVPPPEVRPVLSNWLQFIAEMRGMDFPQFADSITFSSAFSSPTFSLAEVGSFLMLVALPAMAVWLWCARNTVDRLVTGLTVVLCCCALYQQRWLPYAMLGELFCVTRFFQLMPNRWVRGALAVLVLLNVAVANWAQVRGAASVPANQPSPELARLSRAIDAPGGIMAPWWLSPGLLYFSGQPIVSGSSHCGITGIAASAEFYTSTSWDDAMAILQQRKVRWVVVWDEPTYVYPLLGSSQEILGLAPSTDKEPGDADATIAQRLVTDQHVPDDLLQLRAVTPHFKLYEVVGAGVTDASSSVSSPVAVR